MTELKKAGLGSYLRDEREKRSLSIEQVASATKINIKLLHSLEDDQYAQLPALPFLKGFIASYCKILNIPSEPLLTEFQEYLRVRSLERPNRESGHKGYAFEDPNKEKNKFVLWGTLAAFVVAGGITLYFLKPRIKLNRNQKLEEIKKEEEAIPVVQVPPTQPVVSAPVETPEPIKAVATAPTPAPISAPPVAPEQKNDPLNTGRELKPDEIKTKVSMKAKENVLIRYQVDNRKAMQFTLKKDLMIVFKAKEQVLIQTGSLTNLLIRNSKGEFTSIEKSENHVKRERGTVWVFPKQVAEKIKEPFRGLPPLL